MNNMKFGFPSLTDTKIKISNQEILSTAEDRGIKLFLNQFVLAGATLHLCPLGSLSKHGYHLSG